MPEWRDAIRARLVPLRLAPEREAEIVDEVAQHMDDRYREMRAAGKDDAAAIAAAWRELEEEGVMARELKKSERSRLSELPLPGAPARGQWLNAFRQDVRYALRSLRHQPTFAVTVVLALALAIGPATAIVSVANWMFWRPVSGIAEPDRMALVWFGRWNEDDSVSVRRISYPNLADVRAGLRSATGLAGVTDMRHSVSIGDDATRIASVGLVTHDFFDVLGVPMSAGRTFQMNEDRGAYGAPVAIISRRLAETTFGAPAAALEQPLTLNRQPFRVIGVIASAFRGVETTSNVDVWVTGATTPYLLGPQYGGSLDSRSFRGPFYEFVARLAPGATPAALQRELDVAVRGLADAHPVENAQYRQVTATVFPGLSMEPLSRDRMWSMTRLLLLLGAVLLLLGSANAANMFIARAIRRGHEMAVRRALGAGAIRLAQMSLIESCVLALGGACGGLVLAILLKQVMQQWLFPLPAGMIDPIPIDWRVVAVTTGAALFVGTLAGLAPAWLAARGSRSSVLVQAAGSRTVSRAPKIRSGLAIAQLGLSLTLLVGALLLSGTVRNLRNLDLGFDPSHLTVQRIDLGSHRYTVPRALDYYKQLADRLRASGAEAAVGYSAPTDGTFGIRVSSSDQPGSEPIDAGSNGIGDRFFATSRTPIVSGREFTTDEAFAVGTADGAPVVINESLAIRLFGSSSALGRSIYLPRGSTALAVTVVGVVRDTRPNLLREPIPSIYFPLGRYQLPGTRVALVARSTKPAGEAIREVRAAAAAIDPLVPVSDPVPASDMIDRSIRQQRLFAGMLSWLSAIAFVLAAVGLHGLVAQTTAERAREFGIRLAIGATPAAIARLVARYVATITILGTMLGLLMAWLGTPLVKSLLFGVEAIDLRSYVLAVGILAAIVALAAARPAFRATRVHPVEVLRAE